MIAKKFNMIQRKNINTIHHSHSLRNTTLGEQSVVDASRQRPLENILWVTKMNVGKRTDEREAGHEKEDADGWHTGWSRSNEQARRDFQDGLRICSGQARNIGQSKCYA